MLPEPGDAGHVLDMGVEVFVLQPLVEAAA
jgi:hypothetical protein